MENNPFKLDQAYLAGRTESKGVLVDAMSVTDFRNVTGTTFDLSALISAFSDVCPSIADDVTMRTSNTAIAFTKEVIYTVGPQSRGRTDKYWTFNFPTDTSDRKPVHIITMKGGTNNLAVNNNTLTIKKSMLLVLPVFNKLAVALYRDTESSTVFTPLASACFSPSNLMAIADILGLSPEDTIRAINSSCTSGGHILESSIGSLAIVAAISAVRGKSDAIQKNVITKIVKQYTEANKLSVNVDLGNIRDLVPYATNGVPSEFTVENLTDLFRNGKDLAASVLARINTNRRANFNQAVINSGENPSAPRPDSGAIPKSKTPMAPSAPLAHSSTMSLDSDDISGSVGTSATNSSILGAGYRPTQQDYSVSHAMHPDAPRRDGLDHEGTRHKKK